MQHTSLVTTEFCFSWKQLSPGSNYLPVCLRNLWKISSKAEWKHLKLSWMPIGTAKVKISGTAQSLDYLDGWLTFRRAENNMYRRSEIGLQYRREPLEQKRKVQSRTVWIELEWTTTKVPYLISTEMSIPSCSLCSEYRLMRECATIWEQSNQIRENTEHFYSRYLENSTLVTLTDAQDQLIVGDHFSKERTPAAPFPNKPETKIHSNTPRLCYSVRQGWTHSLFTKMVFKALYCCIALPLHQASLM